MLSKPLGDKLAKPLAKNLPWGAAPYVDPWGGLPLPDDASLIWWFNPHKGTYSNSSGSLMLNEGPAMSERVSRWEGLPSGVYCIPPNDAGSPTLERVDTNSFSEIYYDQTNDALFAYDYNQSLFLTKSYIYSITFGFCTLAATGTVTLLELISNQGHTLLGVTLKAATTSKDLETHLRQTSNNTFNDSGSFEVNKPLVVTVRVGFGNGRILTRTSKTDTFNPQNRRDFALISGSARPAASSIIAAQIGKNATSKPPFVLVQSVLFSSDREFSIEELRVVEQYLFNTYYPPA